MTYCISILIFVDFDFLVESINTNTKISDDSQICNNNQYKMSFAMIEAQFIALKNKNTG